MTTYRIVRIAGLHYSNVIESFYRKTPSLREKSYSEQQKALFHQAYAYGDSFSRGMRTLGHDAAEIVYDLEPLQKCWAEEFGVRYRPSYWQWDILLSQIEKMRPDILYFQDIHALPYSLKSELKTRFPFLKLIVIFRGFPGSNDALFKELSTADVLLVGSPILVEKCCKAGLHPHLMPHYFDEQILEKISPNGQKSHDFTFAGSSGYGYGMQHEPRYRFLRELLEKTPLEVWIDEASPDPFHSPYQFAKNALKKAAKRLLQTLPDSMLESMADLPPFKGKMEKIIQEKRCGRDMQPLTNLFPQKCRPGLFGLDMYRLLADSKITFNRHSAPAAGTVDNIRLFQATGVGACLLTDYGSNLHQLFEADREVVAYRSPEECIEKARYLLDHEQERQAIALAGQKRTLKDHTALIRGRQIDSILQNALKV
jgi:spore maturation protein CgeB